MPYLSVTELSKLINDTMQYTGYSKESINDRAAVYEYTAERLNDVAIQVNQLFDIRAEYICAGSRSEGVSQLLESDVDMMYVLRNFLCVDSGRSESDMTVIQTRMTGSPPGYTKLIPVDMNSEELGSFLLSFCTVYDLQEGHILLLSSCFRNMCEIMMKNMDKSHYAGINFDIKQTSGPSVPTSVKVGFGGIAKLLNIPTMSTEGDNVFAMPYLSSAILETWKQRNRKYSWPPRDVIQEISTMEGFVVPVGPTYSEYDNYEWRICFTTAEKRLVSTFCPVQAKLYVLMKMIFKNIISPECDLISSYMVKNVVFWVCEGIDAVRFTREKLIDLLLHSLNFLLQCLHSNCLPNYMIQSRNLLLGKGKRDKIKLCRILRNLLNEGGTFILKIPKLERVTNVIVRSPMLRKVYGEWRNKVEKLSEILIYIVLQKFSIELFLRHNFLYDVLFEGWKDPLYLETIFSLLRLLNVNFIELCTEPGPTLTKIINFTQELFS